ncbi:heme-binding protein [Devosia sp. 919]|uniref:GlcG/HbpS family heme-binding protein n=1 Tax=Devosia sp. 919 TaxID=2726065 RepID=UPI0024A6CD7D|nr:heme-binding protein [Devosia sp. 919]
MITLSRLDTARKILEGARDKSTSIGVPMCIAVADESGNLIAFDRMDGGKKTPATRSP